MAWTREAGDSEVVVDRRILEPLGDQVGFEKR